MMQNKAGAKVEAVGEKGRVSLKIDTPEGEVTMDMSKAAAAALVSELFNAILEAGVTE